MTEYEFLLNDRIQKIRSINELYDLEHNAYISFSGVKDSTVLHYLVDMALPNNKIPRVFMNTGLEYKLLLSYVRDLKTKDSRIIFVTPNVNIREMLEEKGYPFKSKEHCEKVQVYQNSGITPYVEKYITGTGNFKCPEKLRYQFTSENKLKISNKCCNEMKKKPLMKWAKENNRNIVMLGIRLAEGGGRKILKDRGCIFYDTKHKRTQFNP